MATQQITIGHNASTLDCASEQLREGNGLEASRLYWEAATLAIEEASDRIGWQLEPRRIYADVMRMMAPWFPREQTSGLYDSMLMLRSNFLEAYDLDDECVRDLGDDVRELIDMLESVR